MGLYQLLYLDVKQAHLATKNIMMSKKNQNLLLISNINLKI
jgi:hypothetical protein